MYDLRRVSSASKSFGRMYERKKKKNNRLNSPRVSNNESQDQVLVKLQTQHPDQDQDQHHGGTRKPWPEYDAFLISTTMLYEIIDIISSLKTPSSYALWDQHEQSVYRKLCACFGVVYHNLEATPKPHFKKDPWELLRSSLPTPSPTPLKDPETEEEPTEGSYEDRFVTAFSILVNHLPSCQVERMKLSTKERVSEVLQEVLEQLDSEDETEYDDAELSKSMLSGPYVFGCYSSEHIPDRIPYHLYLLVKEAVDTLKDPKWPNSELRWHLYMVECKIFFFCTYFSCHLPPGWEYLRRNAPALIAGIDATTISIKGYKDYSMDGYTPISIKGHTCQYEVDKHSELMLQEIVDIMTVVHSKKTPTFWSMTPQSINFYCRLCSCFGIDYQHLEDASMEDVCLMNMGRDGNVSRFYY